MNLKYKTFAAIYFGVILILSPFVALYVSTIIYFVSLVNFVKGAWISLYKEDEEIEQEDPTDIWGRHIAKMKIKNDLN